MSQHRSPMAAASMKSSQSQISEIEKEIILFFVNAAQALGLPKSYGEIYGLYFASDQALALDDVIEKLQISKGSASQGIRFLKSINALNPTYIPGDRRDHHIVETSLRLIADGFIKERLRPQLKNGSARLETILEKDPACKTILLTERIATIQAWSHKAELLLPIISKFLGPKTKDNALTI
ncbi:MAG: transcriptional regulator [Symploca sp. SIO2D2]|nr:transcriptional regulator [Symploca sp. SIO2D2]